MTKWATVILLCSAFVVSTILAIAETEIIQTQAQFESALRHTNHLLHMTIIDDRTGVSWTGCTLTGLLAGAITIEQGGQRRAALAYEAIEKAATVVSNTSRVFHFSNPKALYNLTTVIDPTASDGSFSRACRKLRESGCLQLEHLTGQFVPCRKVEKPDVQ